MKVKVERFTLEGCQCRIKSDPKELQSLLYQKIRDKVGKKQKQFSASDGELTITGSFTEIDGGNFALHFMLAFLGKASIACRVQVAAEGRVLLDEPLRASATCACFTPGSSQLKTDVNVLADQIVKKAIKAIKSFRK